jgi:iron complex outermembrane recepter protein
MRIPASVLGLAALSSTFATHAEAPAKEQGSPLEEIVVTATRRETDLQKTPLAITAFNQQTLDDHHVVSLLDVRGLVPNLQFFENGDHAVPLIFIRGLGTRNQTEAGDQGIAFYSDGVFSARSQGTTVMLYDLDRVEVLRGPQGTLFGRNSTGGAIAIHTAKPSTKAFDAAGEITAGEDALLALRGMVNVPVTDTWALRVAGATKEQDGRTHFATDNQFGTNRNYGTVDLSSFRISSMYSPTENIHWFLAYENFKNQGTGDVGSTDFDHRVNDATAPGNLDLNSDNYRTRIDAGFGDGYTVSYIGGYSQFDQSQLYGNQAQGDTRNTVYSTYDGRQHELQLTSPGDQRFAWTAGLFYFKEENSIRFDMLHGSWGFTTQDDPNGVLSSFVQPNRSLESKSVYGQGTFKVTDALRFTAGARYIDDTRQDKGGRSIDCTYGLVGPLPDNIAAQASDLNGAQGCFYRQYNDMKGQWNKTTYMLRGEYDLNDSMMLYLSYATGWKSGVLQDGKSYADLVDANGNLDFSRNDALLQEPEEVDSTEFGIKTNFANWRLSANVFYMSFDNMQVTGAVIDPVTGQSTLTNTNAGGATIQGVELEASVALFDAAGRLDATAAYLDATYDEFLGNESNFGDARGRIWNPCGLGVEPSGQCTGNVFNFAGNNLPYAPQYQLSLTYTHTFLLADGASIEPRVRASYYDDMYLGWENRTDRPPGTLSPTDPGEKDFGVQPAYTIVDLSLGYHSANGQWQVEGFINNVTDESVKTEAFYGTPVTFYKWGEPRQGGVRVAYRYR